MKEKYLLLNNHFDTCVGLKEKEYYECSFFCNKYYLEWAMKTITENGIIIGFVHDNNESL